MQPWEFKPPSLQPHLAQPQRVADDRDRTQRHGRGGDDGIQENPRKRIERPRRHRHAQGVIEKGEEQVLADIAHGRPAQPPGADDAV